MKRERLFLVILFLLVTARSLAQSAAGGKVLSEDDGQPVAGATVQVVGTKIATLTDADGRFSISGIPSSARELKISYVGYKTQTVGIGGSLTVRLAIDDIVLDEVVATAFGVSRQKKALGYAAQDIKAEDLVGSKDNNILNSLSGKFAGVRITNTQGDVGSSRIVIRGETSISGENQPLFIIDGIPIDNSQLNAQTQGRDPKNAIADLNPEDIESITVLKGPNASALYGARAAHGTILITTKSGRGSKGLGISFHSSTQISAVASLPDFQNVFGQGAGGQFSYVDGKGGGVNDGVDESWGPKLDIGLLIPQFDSPVDENGVRQATPWVSHPDNVKDFFRTGLTLNNGISIARSGDGFQFRLGYNNEYQRSVVPGASNHKNNFTLNVDYDVTKWLTAGATANYIIFKAPNIPGSAGASGGNYRSNSVMLQYLWFGRQVDDASLKEDYSRNWNASYYSNPYWNAYYNTYAQERHRLIGDVHLNFHIAKDLDLRLKASTDWYQDRRKAKVKWGTSGTPYGKYEEDAYTLQENNAEAIVTYKRQLTDDFHADVLFGFNVRNKQYENNYQAAPRLAVADLYTLTNSRDQLTSSNYYYRLRQYGVYGSLQFDYRNCAFLNVTGRNDWSSTLPRENNSYFYPSVTASVLLDRVLGFHNRVVDYLKLRGGWSQVGADAAPYLLTTIYNSETAFEGNPLQTTSGVGMNPNLKPETTSSTEAGLEAHLFGNRLRLDFSYYQTDSRNQILKLATTAASGFTSQVRNAGHIRNRGIEAQVGVTPVRTKNWEWNIDANYGLNRSKVLKLDDEGLIQSYQLYSSGIQVLATVGEAYGTLFGSAYERDGEGRIVVDANGLPKVSASSKILGKFSPDWSGSLSSALRYKNWTLSVLVDASIGGQIFSNTNKTGIYTGVLESTLPGRSEEYGGLWYYVDAANNKVGISRPDYTTTADGLYYANINGNTTRVFQDGIIVDGVDEQGNPNRTIVSAENYYHRLYSIAEANTFSASYVKLRELSLTYAFPKRIISRAGIQGASLTLSGRNLLILHKDAPNIDPEASITAGNAQGVEAYTLPTARTFGVNLTVSF